MRFFSESRDMSEALLFYYIGIYAVTMSYLIIPFHTFFRTGEDEELETHIMRYVERLLRKKMSKKDLELFLNFINEYQNYRADFINGEGWDTIKTWAYYHEGPTQEDDDVLNFGLDCLEENDFFWVSQYHNYFFFNKFLKDHMRDAVYNCFPNKELLSTSEDMDKLVEIFFNKFVYSYVPAHAAWIPAAAVAGSDSVGWFYNINDTHILNDLNKNAFAWEMYNKDIYPDEIDMGVSTFFSYKVFTLDQLGYSSGSEDMFPKYPWKLYSRDLRHSDWKDASFNDLMPSRVGVLNTILSHSKLTEKFFMFEYWWNNNNEYKLYRSAKNFATHPSGTDWAIITKRKPIYKKFDKKFWKSQVKLLRGFEALKFKDFRIPGRIDYMAENVRKPAWIKDRTSMYRLDLDCELTLFFWKYNAIPRPWRSIWRYFFIYRREHSYGWWASHTENELCREGTMRTLVNPFMRLRSYFYLMYGLLYSDAFRENAIYRDFMNDGENPYAIGTKYLFFGWHLEPDVEDVFRADLVFDEWSRVYQPDNDFTVFNQTTPFNDISYGGKSFDTVFDTYYFDFEIHIDFLDILANIYYKNPEMLVNDVRFIIGMSLFYLVYNYVIRLLVIKYIKKEDLNRYNIFPILQSFRNFKEFMYSLKKLFSFLIGFISMGIVITILGWQYRGLENPFDILFLENLNKKQNFKQSNNPIVLPREIGQKFFYKGSNVRRSSELVWSDKDNEYLHSLCQYLVMAVAFVAAGFVVLCLGLMINTIVELPEIQRVESFLELNKRVRKLHGIRLDEIFDSKGLERSKDLIKKRRFFKVEHTSVIAEVLRNPGAYANAIRNAEAVCELRTGAVNITETVNYGVRLQHKTERLLGHSIEFHSLDPRQQRRALHLLTAYNRELTITIKMLDFHALKIENDLLDMTSSEMVDYINTFRRMRRFHWIVGVRAYCAKLTECIAARELFIEEQNRVLKVLMQYHMKGRPRR